MSSAQAGREEEEEEEEKTNDRMLALICLPTVATLGLFWFRSPTTTITTTTISVDFR